MESTRSSSCGKMCQEPLVQTEGAISRRSSKASAKSATQTYLYLNRKSGAEQDSSWETITVSDGGSSMLQVGESPKEESVSLLSWILEDNVPDKYFLSEKACRGILRRSSEKGKPLPELLTIALENTIALMRWKTTPMTAEFDWSQITLFRPSTKEWEPGGVMSRLSSADSSTTTAEKPTP